MNKSKLMVPVLATMLLAGMWMTNVKAQDKPETNDRQARQRDNRGGERGQRMSREDMMKRMSERMKTLLEASDEEWTVLEPQILKVTTLQRETRGGGMMGQRRGRGGPGGQEGQEGEQEQRELAPVAKASQELRTTLENKDASADAIKTKLTALRDARTKAAAQLSKAQEELRGMLSSRQEAQLVMMNLLD